MKAINKIVINALHVPGKLLLRRLVKRRDFSIFSNDCYGGEVYRWLAMEYNTPFIGLMVMAPCYIKFLQSPQRYLNAKLSFVLRSSYAEMNQFRDKHNNYPVGVLDDIEIHFLHYANEQQAKEKWQRRSERINWNNLKIKFAIDKDYATHELLTDFAALPYKHKVCFSRHPYIGITENIQVPNYHLDATVTFINSLKVFNLIGWLNKGTLHFENVWQRMVGQILYRSLKN